MHKRLARASRSLFHPTRLRLARSFALILTLALCSIAGAAGIPVFPALMNPPSNEHHLGKVVLVELITPDLAAAKQFYGGLFGWTFTQTQGGGADYAQAMLDGRPVAGLIHKAMPANQQRQPAWLTFLSVRDVDAAKTKALAHGGTILFEPHNLPQRGREAVFRDPQGAAFAVLASSSGDPPDVLASPGEWIWSSLITKDPDSDAAFYQTLFDYDVFDESSDSDTQHLTLASDQYARASANSLPSNKPNVHPHWLNFVRVADAQQAAAKATALGGRVLVAPREDRHGGKLAVLADPSGAPFGVLEWTDADQAGRTP